MSVEVVYTVNRRTLATLFSNVTRAFLERSSCFYTSGNGNEYMSLHISRYGNVLEIRMRL